MRALKINAYLVVLLLSLFISFTRASPLYAKSVTELQSEIKKYEEELIRLGEQAKTLSNQIMQFDTKIRLTELKINETEEKLAIFVQKIQQLDEALTQLIGAFSSRARETYIMSRLSDNPIFIVSSSDLAAAVSRYYYLKKVLEEDRVLLLRLQESQAIYTNEKNENERLVKLLEDQRKSLAIQKKDKSNLLVVTRNNEKKYQELLAVSRAELAITLGQGSEIFLRDVGQGEKLGMIISGSSGCSSGTHLHFEVHQGESILDPNNYLKNIAYAYQSPYDISYYGAVNPHGDWEWPLNSLIEINQGYGGSHAFAKIFYPDGNHHGIDMDSNDKIVKSVKPGRFYAGSYQCGGRYTGTLTYAKIEHADGFVTWYLHMLPQ